MYILELYQIDIVKGLCNGNILLIWYWFVYQLIMILEDENNIRFNWYFIFYTSLSENW